MAEYDTLRERIRVAVESPVRDLKDMEALDKDVQKLPVDLGEGVAQLHERVTAARKWCEAVRKAAPKKAASIAAMKERVTRDEASGETGGRGVMVADADGWLGDWAGVSCGWGIITTRHIMETGAFPACRWTRCCSRGCG